MSGLEQLDLAEATFLAKDYAAAFEHARGALLAGLDLNAYDSERGEYAPKEQSSRAEQVLAMALLETGELDAALEHADRAVNFAREDKRPWGNRGHLRRERGELELALADLTRALTLDPTYTFARFRRAQCLHTLARLEEAEQDLNVILIKDPLDASPFALWQEVRAQRGLANDASALPAPTEVNGLIARAQAFTGHNEPARALADYDAAVALNQGPYALLCRGLLYRSLGNLEQARADIEPWLSLDPSWAKYIADLDREIAANNGV